jgi:Holliday junction resolvase
MLEYNPARTGRRFEERVKQALLRNHYMLIDKNMFVRNYAPEKDSAKKREYDLVMFNTREKEFYVIECKAHMSRNNLVAYEQVRKFHAVALNYGGRWAKKLIVTDTALTRRAYEYAISKDIEVINGKKLSQMESRPQSPHLPFLARVLKLGLEGILEKTLSKA